MSEKKSKRKPHKGTKPEPSMDVPRESARQGSAWVELPLTEETELEKQIEAEFRRAYGHDPREVEALVSTRFLIGGVRYTVANWD